MSATTHLCGRGGHRRATSWCGACQWPCVQPETPESRARLVALWKQLHPEQAA